MPTFIGPAWWKWLAIAAVIAFTAASFTFDRDTSHNFEFDEPEWSNVWGTPVGFWVAVITDPVSPLAETINGDRSQGLYESFSARVADECDLVLPSFAEVPDPALYYGEHRGQWFPGRESRRVHGYGFRQGLKLDQRGDPGELRSDVDIALMRSPGECVLRVRTDVYAKAAAVWNDWGNTLPANWGWLGIGVDSVGSSRIEGWSDCIAEAGHPPELGTGYAVLYPVKDLSIEDEIRFALDDHTCRLADFGRARDLDHEMQRAYLDWTGLS